MDFIKKYWIWIVIAIVLLLVGWYFMSNGEDSKTEGGLSYEPPITAPPPPATPPTQEEVDQANEDFFTLMEIPVAELTEADIVSLANSGRDVWEVLQARIGLTKSAFTVQSANARNHLMAAQPSTFQQHRDVLSNRFSVSNVKWNNINNIERAHKTRGSGTLGKRMGQMTEYWKSVYGY